MSFTQFRDMPCGGGGTTVFPFNVITIVSGDNNSYALVQDGSLLKSLQPDDKQNIIGLNTYFQVNAGDNIWLELQFDDHGNFKPDPDGANINNGPIAQFNPALPAFSSEGNSFVQLNDDDPDNPYQQYAKILIAQISGVGTSSFTSIQRLSTNLIMNNSCIDFRATMYPIPSADTPYIEIN